MAKEIRTLIKIDGPNGKDLHHIAVTAGEGRPTTAQCPLCRATMYEFTLYVWRLDGPSPIYTGAVCGAEECQ